MFNSTASRILLAIIIGVVGSVTAALAQTQGGEVESFEVEIKDIKELTLPTANRNFERIPPRASEPIKPPIRYDFQSFNFSAPQVNPQIRPLKLKPAAPGKIYGGYLRAGYGNFGSPLLEGYITSRKDRDKLVGASLYHFSSAKGPVDGKNSGSGNSKLSLFGRTFNETFAVSGRVDAENRTTHFYGYPEGLELEASDIKQAYNLFKISGDVSNARNSDFSYKLGAVFSHLADKYDARETEADLLFNSGYKTGNDSRINIDASYAYMRRQDSEIDGGGRNLFVVTPSYSFMPVEDLLLRIGLSVTYENDTLESKDLHIYPVLHASYPVSPSVDLVASLVGSMEKVSLQTLSYKNIWLAPNLPVINNTNKYYDFNLGINSRLGNKVGVSAGVTLSSYRNMHFFTNAENTADQPYNQAKFNVVYETGWFNQTNLYGSITYAQSEKVKLMFRGDLFAYNTTTLEEPWHMPRYKMTANASFNVLQKLLLNFDVIGQGGMKALEPATNDVVKLDGAMDVNAKLEYLFSDSFSLFVQFNNITGNDYPIYLYYPVRGFQFLGGFTWTF